MSFHVLKYLWSYSCLIYAKMYVCGCLNVVNVFLALMFCLVKPEVLVLLAKSYVLVCQTRLFGFGK
jgi:hypothetical protein